MAEEHNADHEQVGADFDSRQMIFEAAGPNFQYNLDGDDMHEEEASNEEATRFYNLLRESEDPLYDGHEKHAVLSAVSKIIHYKAEHDCSERAIDDMLTLIKEFLPANDKLPVSYYVGCDSPRIKIGNDCVAGRDSYRRPRLSSQATTHEMSKNKLSVAACDVTNVFSVM